MKPGSRDKKVSLRITGLELDELQRHTWKMAESSGLDGRIIEYQGKRPIGLYRWDLDYLQDVLENALQDPGEYPDHSAPDYAALRDLLERIRQLYEDEFKP